jgi:hypothetical protein
MVQKVVGTEPEPGLLTAVTVIAPVGVPPNSGVRVPVANRADSSPTTTEEDERARPRVVEATPTVKDWGDEVEPAKLASPEYTAVTDAGVPDAVTGSSLVWHVVAGSVMEHKKVAPASTVTVPVGLPPPACGVAPAVNTTVDSCPYVTDEGASPRVVVVGDCVTVNGWADEFDGELSPFDV